MVNLTHNHIHRMLPAERWPYVPREGCEPPVPDWKRRSWARDVLPKDDPAERAEPL